MGIPVPRLGYSYRSRRIFMRKQSKKSEKVRLKVESDRRFKIVYDDLLQGKKVKNVTDFARRLGETTPNNIFSIFRSAAGHTSSVRHVNDNLINKLAEQFSINQAYIKYGTLPVFNRDMNDIDLRAAAVERRPEINGDSPSTIKTILKVLQDENILSDDTVEKLLSKKFAHGANKHLKSILNRITSDDEIINNVDIVIVKLIHRLVEIVFEELRQRNQLIESKWITSNEARSLIHINSPTAFLRFIKKYNVKWCKVSRRMILVEFHSLMSTIDTIVKGNS
jgi:hypothetical protein